MSTGRLVLTDTGTRRMTWALPPSAALTAAAREVMSAAGALTSTATSWARPRRRACDWFTIPSTPAIPSSACPPNVSVVRAAAATGYPRPAASRADRADRAVVTRSPAANSDHTCRLAAVAGGIHGRSAAAGAPSTVSGLPLTVIRAPSMGSTARTWPSFLTLARSAAVTPPGAAAMMSGTTRRGTAAPAAEAALAGLPLAPGAASRCDDACTRALAPGRLSGAAT